MNGSNGWPETTGRLVVGSAAEREYGADFGGLVRSRPAAALRAADVDDVVAAVRHAGAHGLTVVPRGEGHTTRGQAHRDGALVIDVRDLDGIGDVEHGIVRVGAGACWSDVVTRTWVAGLAPPVLTDYVGLTVGGTLSVGGVGGQSFRHGLQVDNVIELEVVTGAGERIRCSASHERELFDACRGGLGQFGVIVEATLRLTAAPDRVRVTNVACPDLATFLDAQLATTEQDAFDYVLGNLVPTGRGWAFEIECVEYVHEPRRAPPPAPGAVVSVRESGFLEYVQRLDPIVRAWRRAGAWTELHPWIDLFVGRDGAEDVIGPALDQLDAGCLGGGYVMTYPLARATHRAPLPGFPAAERLFLFDILPSIAPERSDRLAAVERLCDSLLERALARGATVYPIGYPVGTTAMDAGAWAHQHERHRAALSRVRRRFDPRSCFGGSSVFARLD